MTPPAPARDALGGRAYNDLRNLARRHQRDPAEYITLYALEGFLARLAASEFAADFVLKGGVLMAAFAPRRPTRDVDFAARSFTNDTAEVEQRIRQIVSAAVPDGLEFESTSVRGDPIWPAPTEAALPAPAWRHTPACGVPGPYGARREDRHGDRYCCGSSEHRHGTLGAVARRNARPCTAQMGELAKTATPRRCRATVLS